MTRMRMVGAGVAGALLGWLAASGALAQVLFSPDITAELGTVSPSVVTDEGLAVDDASGTVVLQPPAGLPPEVDVIAYELEGGGTSLLSFDVTTSLPGLPAGSPAEPRDVVRFDPGTGLFSFAFDGSTSFVPANARVDSVGLHGSGDLLLSFDTTMSLPGIGPVFDEDLVRFTGFLYSMEFDGSANGIDPALDLDGASADAADLLLSFDGSGSVGGVVFDDEDAIRFDTGFATYAMAFDGSASDPSDWPAADLVALPEPAAVPGLAAGALLILGARRVRR